MERDELETLIGMLGTVDHRRVEWANVRWTAYLIHQHLRYDYPGRIHDLRQKLVIIPPERHGGQRLVTYKLEVSGPDGTPPVAVEQTQDQFGNLILSLGVEAIERAIDFTAWIVIERDAAADPVTVTGVSYADRAWREPSPLTAPDDALHAAAAELRGAADGPLALAERINTWVHGQMTYAHDVTGVRTSAAEAFALRQGVCQDYAHIMLALCRLCELPARYISGHLLGEGGTHAWVEILVPDPRAAGRYIARPFDPTHGTKPSFNYITIAVGRDYGDVTPTSGTFRAPYAGQLFAKKRAGVTAVEYYPPPSHSG